MRVFVCGVRGSTPAPGQDFVRYGGNTSCLALASDGEPPTLLLDAGTGLGAVGPLLRGEPFRGAILLTHLHWDHTHGLPFFPAGDRPDAEVDLHVPTREDAADVLRRAMSPPHFPIGPEGLRGRWRFTAIDEGVHTVGAFSVLAREIPHKGGRTFGYRVSDGRSSLAYLPDHDPLALGAGPDGLGAYHEAACTLAEDVDLLVHDAQWTAHELPTRAVYGHSAIDYSVGLAGVVGSHSVLLFHHAPGRTDKELDDIAAAQADGSVRVTVAAEGQTIDLPVS